MKYTGSEKNKKNLIAQYLNDLKLSNAEKIGNALLNLFMYNYTEIDKLAKDFSKHDSHFVKFICCYIFAMRGDFANVSKLLDYIVDDSVYIRKITIGGLNSIFAEKIVMCDYKDVTELKKELSDIKKKLESIKEKVRWDNQKNIFVF